MTEATYLRRVWSFVIWPLNTFVALRPLFVDMAPRSLFVEMLWVASLCIAVGYPTWRMMTDRLLASLPSGHAAGQHLCDDPILDPATQPSPAPWPLTETWLEQQVGRLPSIDGYSADIERELKEIEWGELTTGRQAVPTVPFPQGVGGRGPHPRPTAERRQRRGA